MRRPELLIPAGNLEKLRTALLYGADAVYVGIPGLSLRAPSAEMTPGDLAVGISEAHQIQAKVYAAVNTFARNSDLDVMLKAIPLLMDAGIDALIVSDPGLIRLIRSTAPQISLHLSTQANTTNIEAVRFWRDQGVSRIILARELPLKDIGEITAAVPEMELEIFIHGAMCMAYSGRCYLSALRNRRSANEGDCTQPCRWEYVLRESTRPDDPFILEEDERFSYILSSKDLCLIEYLPEIFASGVKSFKIEGRMKSSYYAAVVTRTYRQAIDAFTRDKNNYKLNPVWLEELQKVSHRGYTTGFAFSDEKITETSPDIKNIQTHEPAGIVMTYNENQNYLLIDVRNHLKSGECVEILLRDSICPVDTHIMLDENRTPIHQAHAGNRIFLPFPVSVPKGAILRKKQADRL